MIRDIVLPKTLDLELDELQYSMDSDNLVRLIQPVIELFDVDINYFVVTRKRIGCKC